MNIDEKAEIPATLAQIWPDTTLISRKTIPERTLRRRRAEARAKWPMYMSDVAYRIETAPAPPAALRADLERGLARQFSLQLPPGDSPVGL